MDLVDRLLAGDRRAVARLISLVENGAPESREALAALFPHTGHAHIVGITGSPGSGKSTLVNQIAKAFRRQGATVGIVAVDPTSPFSGGAILGDRIRMQELCGDPGVFIRSMATRGALGGLARATSDVVKVLDAFGKDVILVETVGVGQDEVDIARAAHTTVVVEAPGMGDDIQALKAGVMEIADILVVNKADREGAERTVAALEMMLDLNGHPACGWQIPVLKTVATQNEGIAGLVDATLRHRQFLLQSGNLALRERERVDRELADLVQERLRALVLAAVAPGEIDALVDGIVTRRLDPYAAADVLVQR
ncbi:MAG: methylmalonyl Co-A mutase-associated GTPase MeaB, partial [Chloroflexota bacterium]|nr:methylmalonyl Co-A mutase-associated GTPase MeaB [Chloroflexota bacterium]